MRAFLQLAEMRNRFDFHALFGDVLELSHDSGLEVAPHPFVRVEFRRVSWQEMKGELSVEGFHKITNHLRLVSGMTIDNQEDLPLCSMDKPLDKLDEVTCTHRAFNDHESKHALRADRRDHIKPEIRS